jgi:pyrroline-5-carboxylate reductase
MTWNKIKNKTTNLGFIGAGHITQAICRGLILENSEYAGCIYVTNRTPHKAMKLKNELGVHYLHTSEEVLEACDLIFLAVKPSDLRDLADEIAQFILPHHHIVSLAAGVSTNQLRKLLNHDRISRVIPNTAVSIKKGVIGIFSSSKELSHTLGQIFEPLGTHTILEDEALLNSLLIATSSGLGFVLELMTYYCEWLESHGFTKTEARKLIETTFQGAGLMASLSPTKSLEVLIAQVASKKGVTASGLDSMRALEVDRSIRMSLDSAQKRNEELARLLS